jgi:hypothetical protein
MRFPRLRGHARRHRKEPRRGDILLARERRQPATGEDRTVGDRLHVVSPPNHGNDPAHYRNRRSSGPAIDTRSPISAVARVSVPSATSRRAWEAPADGQFDRPGK